MIKDHHLLSEFERNQIATENLSYKKRLDIIESLWQEARDLGALDLSNPLEGIETDIKIARILNQCSRNLSQK